LERFFVVGHPSETKCFKRGSRLTVSKLEEKFDGLVKPIPGNNKAESLKKLCWSLAKLKNVNAAVATAKSG